MAAWRFTLLVLCKATLRHSNLRRRKKTIAHRTVNKRKSAVSSGKFLIANATLGFEQTFPLTSSSTYEPGREESFAALGAANNTNGLWAMYDYLAAEAGRMSITLTQLA